MLEKAKSVKTVDASIRISLGYAYAMRKKFDRAIAEVKEAVRINPTDNLVEFFLGHLYLANGDKEAAIAQHRMMQLDDPELARKLLMKIHSDKILVIPQSGTLGFR